MAASPRLLLTLVATILAAALSGCGSTVGSTVSTASPSPGPLAVVADRVSGALVTMAIDPQTGAPSPIASLNVSDPLFRITSATQIAGTCAMAADPLGRFVYMAFNGHLGIYAVDKTSGRLTEGPGRTLPSYSGTRWLAASERQVHGVFEIGQSFVSRAEWMAFQLDASIGSLAKPACFQGCDLGLPDRASTGPSVVLPESSGRFVYSDFFEGALTTSEVRPDGSLVDIGSPLQLSLDAGSPVWGAIGPGFLAVADGSGNLQTAAVNPSTGMLTPRQMAARAFAGASETTPEVTASASGLIALAGVRGHPGPWGLEVWRVSSMGVLDRRAERSLPFPDEVSPPGSNPQHVAFDPSGRFLYVSGSADGIHVFAVSPDGALRDIGIYALGIGPIAMVPR